MESLTKNIEQIWIAFKQAPIAFIAAILIASFVIWNIIDFRFSAKLEALEARNKLQLDQLEAYKSKLSGASPDEAKARIDKLESQTKQLLEQVGTLIPRHITPEQIAKLKSSLGSSSGRVDIEYDAAVADARRVQAELANCFSFAGWTVITPMVMGPSTSPPSGIAVFVNNVSQMTERENLVVNAFRNAGVSFDLVQIRSSTSNPEKPDIEILISARLI